MECLESVFVGYFFRVSFLGQVAECTRLHVRHYVYGGSGCVRITDGSIHGHEAVDGIAILAQAVQLPESTCLTPLPEEPDDTTPESYESFEDENDPSASRIGRLDDDPDEETDRKKKAKKQEPTGKTANDEDRKPGGLPSLIGKLYDGIRRMTEDNSDQFQD